jgi:hypothetical protein
VLTDGRDLPVSIWDSALGEISSLLASFRKLSPCLSRSVRSRPPISSPGDPVRSSTRDDSISRVYLLGGPPTGFVQSH